jgi:hypothetical protein
MVHVNLSADSGDCDANFRVKFASLCSASSSRVQCKSPSLLYTIIWTTCTIELIYLHVLETIVYPWILSIISKYTVLTVPPCAQNSETAC